VENVRQSLTKCVTTRSIVTSKIYEKLAAGRYEATWDAADFASGVYVYLLQTEDYSKAKKLILLK